MKLLKIQPKIRPSNNPTTIHFLAVSMRSFVLWFSYALSSWYICLILFAMFDMRVSKFVIKNLAEFKPTLLAMMWRLGNL